MFLYYLIYRTEIGQKEDLFSMPKELEEKEEKSSAEETPKKEEQEDAPKWAKNLLQDIQNLMGTKEQPQGQAQEIPVPEPPKVEEPEEEEQPAPIKAKTLIWWLWSMFREVTRRNIRKR
ncbi:hypothetical protein ACFXPG_44620, partial [Streptomyces sp. NPDC059122]